MSRLYIQTTFPPHCGQMSRHRPPIFRKITPPFPPHCGQRNRLLPTSTAPPYSAKNFALSITLRTEEPPLAHLHRPPIFRPIFLHLHRQKNVSQKPETCCVHRKIFPYTHNHNEISNPRRVYSNSATYIRSGILKNIGNPPFHEPPPQEDSSFHEPPFHEPKAKKRRPPPTPPPQHTRVLKPT